MFQLTKSFKDELILGLEIRDKVANFAGEKINSIRNNSGFKECLNIGVLRTNAMKSLHNYFKRESVSIPHSASFFLMLNGLDFSLAGQNVLLLC